MKSFLSPMTVEYESNEKFYHIISISWGVKNVE